MPTPHEMTLRERKKAEARAKVLATSHRLFHRASFDATTLETICTESNISKRTFFRYFRDKDDILATVRAAAFNRFATALENAVANAPDARSKGRAVGDAYVDFAKSYPAAYQLIFSFTQPDEDRYPELQAANGRAQETMVGYVREMIEAGLLKGDAQLIGYMFWATLHGIVVLELASGLRGMDGDSLREKIMRTLYAGMQVTPPTLDS